MGRFYQIRMCSAVMSFKKALWVGISSLNSAVGLTSVYYGDIHIAHGYRADFKQL